MGGRGLVFGLWRRPPASDEDAELSGRLGDLTISWSRYGYSGPILEREGLDEILMDAAATDAQWVLVQAPGHVIRERWNPEHWGTPDFLSALTAWAREREFLIAGRLCDGPGGVALDGSCLLVDLSKYRSLSQPASEPPAEAEARSLHAVVQRDAEDGLTLRPCATGAVAVEADGPARNLLTASVAADLAVPGWPDFAREITLDLAPGAEALRQHVRQGLEEDAIRNDADLSPAQRRFLSSLERQTSHAHHGVFLWNIEAYTDIEAPSAPFEGPVSSLYSVAAGFKPNRILATHGTSPDTRVVFFDYSVQALAVRREIIESWEGRDFPRFAQHLFRKFPAPQTFYQLWADVTPETVSLDDLDRMWRGELDRWGGEDEFARHWQQARSLQYEYVLCDIVNAPDPLLNQLKPERGAVAWFSNAFFTMLANWQQTIGERRVCYERFIAQVAEANPDLLLYGSDFNNVNVNSYLARDYWDAYQDGGNDALDPRHLYRHELRM